MANTAKTTSDARVRMGHPKRCAVCGDTCYVNVRLLWRRSCDQKLFDVCLACAEANHVNEHTVDTYGPSPVQGLEAHAAWSESFWDISAKDE